MALYKRAGAQYFFALANHHDNFDIVGFQISAVEFGQVGPKKDLIGGWAAAAHKYGLRFRRQRSRRARVDVGMNRRRITMAN